MLSKMAFFISIGSSTAFIVMGLSNIIINGVYGLSDNKYKLMGSIAIAAISLGIFLVTKPIN